MCQVLVNGVYENVCGIVPLNGFVYGFAWGMITILVIAAIFLAIVGILPLLCGIYAL